MNNDTLKRTVLIISTLSSFTVPFVSSSVNIALPTISSEFRIDAVMLSWIPAAYMLATAMLLLPFGRIADICGRKKIFLIGTIVYTAGSFLAALSISGPFLITCRVLQGIGCAMTFGNAMAILTSVFPREERGRAIGIVTASVFAGISSGPLLGGFLTQHLGWRSVFWINVPLGLLIIVLVAWWLKGKEWADARGEKADLPGSLLYALVLFLVMFGLTRFPARTGIVFVATGCIGLILFIFIERHTVSPILEIRIFSGNPVFTFSSLLALIQFSSAFCVGFLLSLYLQYIKGFSAQGAGLILVSQPLTIGLFSPLAGRLSDRVDPGVIASIGMALTCLGLLMLSSVGITTPLAYIIFNLIILGLGVAFFSSPNSNAIINSVERRHLGVASGTLGTMRVIGSVLSMAVALMIFSMIMGKTKITAGTHPLFLFSMKIIFIITGTLSFLGVLLSLARVRVSRRLEAERQILNLKTAGESKGTPGSVRMEL